MDTPSGTPIRFVRFHPYRRGMGPSFTLTLFDTGRSQNGRWVIGYRLTQSGLDAPLFMGEDFSCPPIHAIDSDATVAAVMAFLTLRPGDTDRDYFSNYTPLQLDYAGLHAEALSAEVGCRFGER